MTMMSDDPTTLIMGGEEGSKNFGIRPVVNREANNGGHCDPWEGMATVMAKLYDDARGDIHCSGESSDENPSQLESKNGKTPPLYDYHVSFPPHLCVLAIPQDRLCGGLLGVPLRGFRAGLEALQPHAWRDVRV